MIFATTKMPTDMGSTEYYDVMIFDKTGEPLVHVWFASSDEREQFIQEAQAFREQCKQERAAREQWKQEKAANE